MKREIAKQARGSADEAVLAMSIGAAAIDEGRPDVAVEYLEWVKSQAPRSGAVREALGVARYLLEEYGKALSELRAYRRLTGRLDQNHLIADAMRAGGEPSLRLADEVEPMLEDDEVPAERRLEGLLVWAGAVADEGSPDAGRAVLHRADTLAKELSEDEDAEALQRLWYVQGDLAERAGDTAAARHFFERVLAAGEDPYDTEERLASL